MSNNAVALKIVGKKTFLAALSVIGFGILCLFLISALLPSIILLSFSKPPSLFSQTQFWWITIFMAGSLVTFRECWSFPKEIWENPWYLMANIFEDNYPHEIKTPFKFVLECGYQWLTLFAFPALLVLNFTIYPLKGLVALGRFIFNIPKNLSTLRDHMIENNPEDVAKFEKKKLESILPTNTVLVKTKRL